MSSPLVSADRCPVPRVLGAVLCVGLLAVATGRLEAGEQGTDPSAELSGKDTTGEQAVGPTEQSTGPTERPPGGAEQPVGSKEEPTGGTEQPTGPEEPSYRRCDGPLGSTLVSPGHRFPEVTGEFQSPSESSLRVEVIGTIDGDTLRLKGGKKVRLIGMNAPETHDPLYWEARCFLESLVESAAEIRVDYDIQTSDSFGRDLCYVYADGRLANGELVRHGLAFAYRFSPNTKYHKTFVLMQQAARRDVVGLWSLEAPEPALSYVAAGQGDPRFHRPSCRIARRRPDILVQFDTRDQAFDSGRCPCSRCRP
ncbi:thermonuclease family protein [Planctomycetota bacterium]